MPPCSPFISKLNGQADFWEFQPAPSWGRNSRKLPLQRFYIKNKLGHWFSRILDYILYLHFIYTHFTGGAPRTPVMNIFKIRVETKAVTSRQKFSKVSSVSDFSSEKRREHWLLRISDSVLRTHVLALHKSNINRNVSSLSFSRSLFLSTSLFLSLSVSLCISFYLSFLSFLSLSLSLSLILPLSLCFSIYLSM
jgi:hypothetical protein